MGSYLPLPILDKQSENDRSEKDKVSGLILHLISKKVSYGVCGMQGWRNYMEDTHICALNVVPGVHFFGVYDGHGGHEVAEFVKEHLIPELKNLQSFKAGKYDQALIDIYDKMDELLRTPYGATKLTSYKKVGEKAPEPILQKATDNIAMQTGCTACSAIITKDEIIVGNAGDSRAVLAKKPANMSTPPFYQAVQMSVDHKPDLASEKQRIMSAGGFVSDNRVKGNLNLARSIGDLEYKSDPKIKHHEQMILNIPDIRKEKVSDSAFLIIACDGIWDCLTSQEAVNYIGNIITKEKEEPLSYSIESMFTTIVASDVQASGGIGTDNMSAIVIKFD